MTDAFDRILKHQAFLENPVVQHTVEYLSSKGIKFSFRVGASMMWIINSEGKWYAYYPTTGRWAPFGMKGNHYRSKSIEDFVDRFLERKFEPKNLQNTEGRH